MAAKKDHSWAMSMLDELKEYFGGSTSKARKSGAAKSAVRKKAKKSKAKKKAKKRRN